MQFTPGQLRETVGISVETYRHWKRVLPPFADRQGYVAGFSIGDLVAARVLRCLTETFGVRAGHLSELSVAIVRLCNASPWAKLIDRDVVIAPEAQTCRMVGHGTESVRDKPIIICPMSPLMMELGSALKGLLPASEQQQFQFPPVEFSDVRRRAGRSS
ncbi:MAG: hypothetical protein J0H78_16410 [Rhizobiales bacterium]|nr:hypothetical protein [Hyphomicrobiales bacterium]OJY45838.1 MAG: hypothetical protein BGP08_06440 [Rhizobiales bacterium 64-17]